LQAGRRAGTLLLHAADAALRLPPHITRFNIRVDSNKQLKTDLLVYFLVCKAGAGNMLSAGIAELAWFVMKCWAKEDVW
jgi:hypothetical protein